VDLLHVRENNPGEWGDYALENKESQEEVKIAAPSPLRQIAAGEGN
jgi:hypothetical protein